MLIKGWALTEKQRRQVLSSFVYRWTKENYKRAWNLYPAEQKPQIRLISDQEWLDDRAFYFVKDGSRLDKRYNHCEMSWVADLQGPR